LLVCATIILIQILLFPNLEKLSTLNGVGILNMSVCVIVVLVVSFAKIAQNPGLLFAGFISYKLFDWRGALVANNICIFTMATLMVPSIFSEMKDKGRFGDLSRLVFASTASLKVAFALIAFFAFQEDTEDVVTLNIDNVTVRNMVSISVVFDKLVTTPSLLYPVGLQIESMLPKPEAKALKGLYTNFNRLIIFTVLLAICIALAMSVSNFAIFSSLVGSILYIPILYIFPVVLWNILASQKPKSDMAQGLWIIVTSAVSLVGGVYQNLSIIGG